MSQIIECVPNFSEGRDKNTIEAIASVIRKTIGVKLLDVDAGFSTNRTVYTFVGNPESVIEAALGAAKVAFQLIDMRKHKGEHPRMGALDVCPFIPVRNTTICECVEISKTFGKKLSQELKVPVYLYGASSEIEHRKTMPQIRSGEYEGLESKLKINDWKPDFGSSYGFVPSWGATVTGVRKFLIAYNINIIATKEQAHRIALNLREAGRDPKNDPGRLKCVQGMGWWLEEYNIAQISLNLTDFDETSIHVAYEEAKKDAVELNLPIIGSEIVGMLPLEALLSAANYYIQKESLFILEEEQKIQLAINRLGLSTLSPFNPRERVIEYCLDTPASALTLQSVEKFVKSVASRTPAPGGGSVSAIVGALGSALGAMVGQLTYGKRQWESLDADMRKNIPVVHQASMDMMEIANKDADAFDNYMKALKMSQSLPRERREAIEESLKKIVEVPLDLAIKANSVWPSMIELAKKGNINCKSDIQVAAICLRTCVQGAIYNIYINLPELSYLEHYYQKTKQLVNENMEIAENSCNILLDIVLKR